MTQRELGIAIVDILSLKKRGKKLFYAKDGREVEVRRIYNRCIVDELERKAVTLPFDFATNSMSSGPAIPTGISGSASSPSRT